MKEIKREQPNDNIVIYHYSDCLSDIEFLGTCEIPSRDFLSEMCSLHKHYGLYYSPFSWKTVVLNGREYFLPQGCFFLIKPEDTLISHTTSEQDGPTFYLELKKSAAPLSPGENLGFTELEWNFFFQCLKKMKSPILVVSLDNNRIFTEIEELSLLISRGKGDPFSYLKLKNLFRELWVILAQGESVLSNALDSRIDALLPRLPNMGYSPLVDNAINQMGDKLIENITLTNIAANLNISLSRFKVRFKEETGITPLEYFTRISIQKAMLLLYETEESYGEIARQLGYSSESQFSTTFKKTAGLSPEEFRLSYKNQGLLL